MDKQIINIWKNIWFFKILWSGFKDFLGNLSFHILKKV